MLDIVINHAIELDSKIYMLFLGVYLFLKSDEGKIPMVIPTKQEILAARAARKIVRAARKARGKLRRPKLEPTAAEKAAAKKKRQARFRAYLERAREKRIARALRVLAEEGYKI